MIKLLAGFLAVIALLFLFNVLSYTFFYSTIRGEVRESNIRSLTNTAARYENNIEIVQLALVRFYYNNDIQQLYDKEISELYEPFNRIVEQVKMIQENEQFYIDDVIIQFMRDGRLLDKDGPGQADILYAKSYISKAYDVKFWNDQMQQRYSIRLFPEAEFYNMLGQKKGDFIPLVFKSIVHEQMYIAVLIDSRKLYEAFNNFSSDSRFYILDGEGRQIFSSAGDKAEEGLAAMLDDRNNYAKHGNNYYFYKKGKATGLTYVSVLPDKKLADQVSRINAVLLLILVIALIVSVAVSVVVSFRFYSPIQTIVRSIHRIGPDDSLRSKVSEFNLIYDRIRHFMIANQNISRDLHRKTSQLAHLDYINKLKNIYTKSNEMAGPDKPFYLIVFHLSLTRRFHSLMSAEQDKAAYFIKEFINLSFTGKFDHSVTLQSEKDQILSLIFCENDSREPLETELRRLKQIFDRDKEYCYLTIAVNPSLRDPSEFPDAYEQALEMVQKRKLLDETQIITGLVPEPLIIGFIQAQEQEFYAHLQAGNTDSVHAIVSRILTRMEKEEASASQYTNFAKEVVEKVIKTMVTMNLDISRILEAQSPYQIMKQCTSAGDYADLLHGFLDSAAQIIAEKKEGSDHIFDFVVDYLHTRYKDDISLEQVADKLNLTASYISRYFKGKSGMNFSDYLNDVRIRKAKEMLVRSNTSIRSIAEQVGYVNVTSFIRMFKKVTGVPPSEFRRVHTIAGENGSESACFDQ